MIANEEKNMRYVTVAEMKPLFTQCTRKKPEVVVAKN